MPIIVYFFALIVINIQEEEEYGSFQIYFFLVFFA